MTDRKLARIKLEEDTEDDELSSTEEEQPVRRGIVGNTGPQKRKRVEENNGAESESLELNSDKDIVIENLKSQLESTVNQVQLMRETVNVLVDEVSNLKHVVLDLKNTVKERDQITETNLPQRHLEPQDYDIPARFASNHGPFPRYTQMDRTLPRPSAKEVAETLGGKEHSLQFTSNLYVDLIEKVLGPQEENQQMDYKAMVKEAIMITKAVVSYVKDTHGIDPEIRWSYIDPTVKLETYRILESATEHLLPLKVCLEYWGAHVLISNFWVKRRKYGKKAAGKSPSPHRRPDVSPFSIPFLTNQPQL